MDLQRYLCGVTCAADIPNPQEVEISTVTADSRWIRPGCLFVCIAGGRFDGHDAGQFALEKGAAALICEKNLGLPRQIMVENTRSAYARICANHFGNPADRLRLVGVTGTNGKTTVSGLIRAMLEDCGEHSGLMGTIVNRIGELELPARYTTPDAYYLHSLFARMVRENCRFAVLEASSQALDQRRLDGCSFETAVFTNLTQDHLDYHGDMECYYRAKRRLFEMARTAVVNIDEPYGERLARELGEGAVTCSISGKNADFTAEDIRLFPHGSSFSIQYGGCRYAAGSTVPGRFSVSNALAACAACVSLGFEPEQAARALKSCPPAPGRAEVLYSGAFTVIRDYAHTPDGLEKVLAALRETAVGRLITLFGCGGDRDRGKRPLMGSAAGKNSDLVIVTSDNPRSESPQAIIDDILPGVVRTGTPYAAIPDRGEAIRFAWQSAREGDILLLAGKGHEDYLAARDQTIYFDEKKLIAALAEQVCTDRADGISKRKDG